MEKELTALVKTMYDFQDLRVRLGNRLKKKRDGKDQEITEINLHPEAVPALVDAWQDAEETEKMLLVEIKNRLKSIPIYTSFLQDVKGCGPVMAAVIISEFDIHKATTASKMTQFAGLNPGLVPGTKARGSKKDGSFKTYKTEELVRGDKKTPGFLAPFNGFLRTKLVGVLAPSFLKSNSPYRKFYDDYKHRLENHETWSQESKGHRDNAAKRYMVKKFLQDLYSAWRTLEGLSVRQPYQEQYLGHKHAS